MTQALTNNQMLSLLQNSPALDSVAPSLPKDLQKQLLDLQVRAGNAYNGGYWVGQETGNVFVNASTPAPTQEEAQQSLGQSYLALQDQQTTLKNIMNEMGLTPSARRRNPVEQFMNTVKGWFH